MSVVIIGAGIGGLSAGIRLATAGYQVTILEQNPQVGGKMSEIHDGGFRWDTGPSVITMRHTLDDLFESAGRQLHDYVNLIPVEPLTRYFYMDGSIIDASNNLNNMLAEIKKIDPLDTEGYIAFMKYAAELHRLTSDSFIYGDPPSWRSFLQFSPFDLLKIDGLRSMQAAIEHFVKSPQLRQLLGRFATYVGASPYLAPATLNVIAHVEMAGGVWYPAGGIYSIAHGMRRLAEELGVNICTNQQVRSIDIKDGAVRGVTTSEGHHHLAEAVIANVHVATVYKNLLPPHPTYQRRLTKLQRQEPSCSGFIMLLGVAGTYPELAHHNIFFSQNYEREFDDIFGRGIPPIDPTIYVSITSKSTPADAPAGHENWFILVNAPALGTRWDWDAQTEHYRNLILNRLASRGYDLNNRIVTEHILTPADLERLTGARRGALYGASSNSRWAAFRRPHNRSSDVEGLFFAGGTTHPGGGVPMVTLSGKVAARLVQESR